MQLPASSSSIGVETRIVEHRWALQRHGSDDTCHACNQVSRIVADGLDAISRAVDRRVVRELPHSIQAVQGKQKFLLGIVSFGLSPEDQEFVLQTFNGRWDEEVDQSGRWQHWCCGCCTSQEACVQRCREALRLLFEKFPQVPLLYRWKGWTECQSYTTRGVFVHNFMSFLIRRCCSKQSQETVDLQAMDEDAPDLSYSARQEIRMSKTLALVTSPTVRVARCAFQHMDLVKLII